MGKINVGDDADTLCVYDNENDNADAEGASVLGLALRIDDEENFSFPEECCFSNFIR